MTCIYLGANWLPDCKFKLQGASLFLNENLTCLRTAHFLSTTPVHNLKEFCSLLDNIHYTKWSAHVMLLFLHNQSFRLRL